MMVNARITGAVAALLLGAQVAAAQQPTHQGPPMKPAMGGMMMRMDSLDARLDSLVSRMNRATGNAKSAAMAAVINEIVAQRRAMHQQMRQMHEHMRQMMAPHGQMGPAREQCPDSAPHGPCGADTAGHPARSRKP